MLVMEMHTYNLSFCEEEAGRSDLEASQGYLVRACLGGKNQIILNLCLFPVLLKQSKALIFDTVFIFLECVLLLWALKEDDVIAGGTEGYPGLQELACDFSKCTWL